MFTADWKVISSLLRSLSTHFPVRLPDCTGWKRSPTENSAGDAISVGALWNPCRTTNQHFKNTISLQYKEKRMIINLANLFLHLRISQFQDKWYFQFLSAGPYKLLIQSSLDVPLGWNSFDARCAFVWGLFSNLPGLSFLPFIHLWSRACNHLGKSQLYLLI